MKELGGAIGIFIAAALLVGYAFAANAAIGGDSMNYLGMINNPAIKWISLLVVVVSILLLLVSKSPKEE